MTVILALASSKHSASLWRALNCFYPHRLPSLNHLSLTATCSLSFFELFFHSNDIYSLAYSLFHLTLFHKSRKPVLDFSFLCIFIISLKDSRSTVWHPSQNEDRVWSYCSSSTCSLVMKWKQPILSLVRILSWLCATDGPGPCIFALISSVPGKKSAVERTSPWSTSLAIFSNHLGESWQSLYHFLNHIDRFLDKMPALLFCGVPTTNTSLWWFHVSLYVSHCPAYFHVECSSWFIRSSAAFVFLDFSNSQVHLRVCLPPRSWVWPTFVPTFWQKDTYKISARN